MVSKALFDTYARSLGAGSRRGMLRVFSGGGVATVLSRLGGADAEARKKKKKKRKPPKPAFTFDLVPSEDAEAANCLANARGAGKIFRLGPEKEQLELSVSGLPPGEEFEVFITQVPDAPFGLSWYLGDITTDERGSGTESFVGRFNRTTFIVAPGIAPAPIVHTLQPFPDDNNNNGAQNPVHTFHIGLWFDSANDALEAGCEDDSETPFSAIHRGGIQAISTRNFADNDGPLGRVSPLGG